MPYYYEKVNLQAFLTTISEHIYTHVQPLRIESWLTPEPVPFAQRESGDYSELALGEPWGKLWDCAWMHVTGVVPETARGHKVVLLIDINGEAAVVDADGTPILGLTTVSSQFDYSLGRPGKRVVEVTDSAQGGEAIDFWMEAGANDLFGELKNNGVLHEAHIATCAENMRLLYHDWFVLEELTRLLPADSARRARILHALYLASLKLNAFTDAEAAEARAILAPELAKQNGDPSLKVTAIGHAHMDLGWLWPIRETIRKGGRTFATVIANMNKYPDYQFGGSQPQLFQWVKDYYPALYEKVKTRVADGRWEIQGGMWVEADVNISGGEALARQFLYGQRFWQAEFGKRTRMLWLPDVFGYNGALPQIMKLSGIDYFMTIKISWSKINVFPHHTFIWEGIDGSSVLAHMPPEGTYNSSAAPRAIAATETLYRDKYVSDEALLVYGIGDGGGGPGETHLEMLAREHNLAGIAPVTQGAAQDFFDRLAGNVEEYATWVGELYLEYHQGTLTTQARNKRNNRKLEIALRELEWVSGLAAMASGGAFAYPQLEAIWKEMLLYQFHDILPGSSITRVYTESLERYAVLHDQVQAMTNAAQAALGGAVNTSGLQKPVVVTNSLSWDRAEWLDIQGEWVEARVPSMGYVTVNAAPSPFDAAPLRASTTLLENEQLRVEFAADGAVQSVWDKANGREALAGLGNTLDVYNDPGDAWDFRFDYRARPPQRFELVSATASVVGPKAVLHQVYRYGESSVSQNIILTLGSRRLDFVTDVDWRETDKMLRTRFPVNVHTHEATCDIQFGSIKRPTHRNTTWDMAKIEVAAHKWVDLSQRDYGVALLNDCKYGHHLHDNVLDLNLLRAPGYPDPTADRANHQFTYSLYPHAGDHVAGGVARAAYELNVPLQPTLTDAHAGALPPTASTIRISVPNVIVEAVKKAEDEAATIIRLYENSGAAVTARLDFGRPPATAELVNLLEETVAPVTIEGNSITLVFAPFQIISLKVTTG